MIMGELLLADLGITVSELDHRNFESARKLVEEKGAGYAAQAVDRIEKALKHLYGETDVSLQRLSATFRRGDLLEFLTLGELIG